MTSFDLEGPDGARAALLERLERYYDTVPRSAARAEDLGPLTLFHREGPGWPFYARPLPAGRRPVAPADVARVRARQRELGVPESFEWVAESTPSLRAAAEATGLVVHEHPLMVLVEGGSGAGAPGGASTDGVAGAGPSTDAADAAALADAAGAADGVAIRMLDPEDPAFASALALPQLAFAAPGTGVGPAGPAELDEAVRRKAGDGSLEQSAARVRAGLARVAAAVVDGRALCSGQHQPVGPVSEIVGVGTLPSARRRGLGLAVTAALAADARSLGVTTVFLSAGDEDVARLYARLGFRRVATALIAEPPEGSDGQA